MRFDLSLIAVALIALSGVPGLLDRCIGRRGQLLSTILMIFGGALGLFEALRCLCGGEIRHVESGWFLPWGRYSVRMDALSAVFLVPVFLVPTMGAVYGQAYWKQSEHPTNGRRLRFFYGLLAASMALVVLARDGVLFLIAWEIMALSAFFVATAEEDDPAACDAGWIYLVATHIGTLCLIAMFSILRSATGSFSLDDLRPETLGAARASGLFLLALVGFGFKAGLMPLHVWLPGAHANAPSHVSAVMSGVMLKMGIYGIVRMTGLFSDPPAWWGQTLLAVGAVSGVLGIAFALAQSDLKRSLAYSSIENIGIIAMGLGLALLGRSSNRPDWVALGLAGSLLHVWNHSLFKSLLFLNAGAIVHATGTRNIQRLGGLAKLMPRTATLFAVSALAICALPPLNGFVSELLIYMGLFRTNGFEAGSTWPLAALAAPMLALVGALALACFVNLLGTIFLGQSRSDAARHAHDPSALMTTPMILLALLCAAIGIFPGLVSPAFDRAVRSWSASSGAPSIETLVPFEWISAISGVLVAAALLMALILRSMLKRNPAASAVTWDCGYAGTTSRMEYTGSSFAQMLVGLFGWALRPKRHRPQITGLFPGPAEFKSHVPDTVLDRLVLPFTRLAERYIPWFHILQQGRTQIYVLYFVIILIVLFLWGSHGY